MATKRKAAAMALSSDDSDEPVDESDYLKFTGLGGCQEVGRSCHILQYRGKTVMLDAGMHTGREGMSAMPYFDDFDLSTVDILLISQYVSPSTDAPALQGFWPPQVGSDQVVGREQTARPLTQPISVDTRRAMASSPCPTLLAAVDTNMSALSFHLDHAAALPYVLAKTDFKGRVFMTHPTKAIYKWLIQDSVRVSNTSSTSDQRVSLYTEADHIATLPQIETIDFYTTHTVAGIRFTPYPAGHVLGAAMFLVNIAGLNIFFTGDYSREQDRHLIAAAVPDLASTGKIDVLITESTFGISNAPPRAERETGLLKAVTNIIHRGGKVLMPVFALGRAQELLLILEDYWQRHPDLQKIPIYYTGNTARKCMIVYQTYINAMNDNIKRIFRERMAEAEASGNAKGVSAGPWDFRFVRSLRNLDRFDDVGGCVMLASPGMLQSGMSRTLLERWAPDPRNGVVMTGYNVEGTMGRTILTEPDQIPAVMTGSSSGVGQTMAKKGDDSAVMIPRRCTVEEYQFAAHVTGVENVYFIEQVAAPHVILVHGERSQGARLRSRLLDLNNRKLTNNPEGQQTKVYSPENGAEIKIAFRKDKLAKVVGKLAQLTPPKPGQFSEDSHIVTGVLVQNDFNLSLMAPEDLREYAGLTTTTIICKQHITLATATIELITWALEGTFGSIEELSSAKAAHEASNGLAKTEDDIKEEADEEIPLQPPRTFLIMGCITLRWSGREKQIELEWEGNIANDGISDAVMAVLMTVESSPAAVKYSSSKTHHHPAHANGDSKIHNSLADLTPHARFTRLCSFIEEQFGHNITPIHRPRLHGPDTEPGAKDEGESDEDDAIEQREATERARLAALGLPVPGLEIKVDKHVARVWLEHLDVECAYPVLRDRVKAVVERAAETVAPLCLPFSFFANPRLYQAESFVMPPRRALPSRKRAAPPIQKPGPAKRRNTRETEDTKDAKATKGAKPAQPSKPAETTKTRTTVISNEPPTAKLQVYVFGEGTAGELGLGARNATEVSRPRANPNLAGAVSISTGGMHAIALTPDNRILTWGINDHATLGRDTSWDESTPTAVPAHHFPEGTQFAQVAAGDSTTFVLTKDGFVYGWGTFRDQNGIFGFRLGSAKEGIIDVQKDPIRIPGLKNITQISVGNDFALALDAAGKVYAWGNGQQAELGRRLIERRRSEGLVPTRIGFPKKTTIVSIHAATNHAFAIDSHGDTWAWGSNNFGQTGITSGAGQGEAVVCPPQKVTSLKGSKMQTVDGGLHHSIALTQSGQCLVWGRVDGFQTGLDVTKLPVDDASKVITDARGNPRILLHPTALPIPSSVYVAAGSDHNFAVTAEGKAYSWGFNATYQCGQGTDDDVQTATLMNGKQIRDEQIVWAGAGGQYGMLASRLQEK
ncbi:hypothetical protein DV736_g4006, partial [Chaetothyriales sp. CBS 134916]